MPKLNEEQQQAVEESESSTFLHEPGTYLAVLNKVEEKQGKKAPYWEWEFQVVGNEDGESIQGARIWENTSLSQAALWRLKEMFAAFGTTPDTDTDDLLGQYVWLMLGQEVQPVGQGAGKTRNTFLGALPVDEDQ
jgi:hypothetical protein